jgi:phage shock protein PspC (stress-responsive transcriptional regulator)
VSAPIDPESIPPQVKDGIVAGVLGGLAMVARLLLSTEPVSFGWVVRRVLAAAITAALVGYGIQEHIQSPGLRMAVVGAAGYAAPECLDYLMKYIKARGEKEVAAVVGKPKKPHGKGKAIKPAAKRGK